MVVRVEAGTALILLEAYHKIQALPRGDHYGLYEYVRGVATKRWQRNSASDCRR